MSLFEEARCRYFGKPVLNLLPESFQFPFVLHSTTVRFVAPGSGARENVKVYIKTSAISNSSISQLYRVEHDGKIWCEASALLVGWDVKRKSKANLSDHFRQTVCMFEGISVDTKAAKKEAPPAGSTIVSTYFQREKRALKVGDKASISKTFGPKEVAAFAELSEDRNPLHLDAAFAAKTRFGRPIVHGALFSSLISALLGSTLPGEGTIFVSNSTQFKAPLPVGDAVTATVEVKDINLAKVRSSSSEFVSCALLVVRTTATHTSFSVRTLSSPDMYRTLSLSPRRARTQRAKSS